MADEIKTSKESSKPILHVLVVGFHHKKGCQVEYSYPPLVEGDDDPTACPQGWKYLPTLALPDGSHNYDEDAVYFHLPSLTDQKRTVYGISCYRQIPVEKLKIRTADVTRSTVQKSVCVLSALPLYGHIQVKMALITHAYFDEGDFSQVRLLQDTYEHLNSCMEQLGPLHEAPQLFVGLSPRELILQFGHKALLLFKLLLLERKLVFYRSPVQPLCAAILTLLSLHPGMIESGLAEAACIKPSRPMSPMPDFSDQADDEMQRDNSDNAARENVNSRPEYERTYSVENENNLNEQCSAEVSSSQSKPIEVKSDSEIRGGKVSEVRVGGLPEESLGVKSDGDLVRDERDGVNVEEVSEGSCGMRSGDSVESVESQDGVGDSWMEVSTKLSMSESLGNFPGASSDVNMAAIAQMNAELCGMPLPLFTQGNLCLPYLSLPYMDLLSDINVRGFVVGATNVLFKQKRNLADVLIEVEGARVETQDAELRRQLQFTTEDLRFADYVVRRVAGEKHDVFLDGVGWEGGDEWIRSQFKAYALCLLRTSLLQDGSRELEHFNASYMAAWKTTHNYRRWQSADHAGIWELNPGHPFAGQLSVADMKLRLAHTMQNTEGGRKLNQAMATTGRAVATTGRAVGGAISQAKGALSNWWTTLVTVQPTNGDADEFVAAQTSYQPVPDASTNLAIAGIEPSQLERHVSPQKTRLTSVENIECSPSTYVIDDNETENTVTHADVGRLNSNKITAAESSNGVANESNSEVFRGKTSKIHVV